MIVLLDAGHGVETPGKRSPDGRLREYAYAREIAGNVYGELLKKGYDADLVVKTDMDISLSDRVKYVNSIYKEAGGNALLVSIHCNAAGDGSEWMNARGWSAYVSLNASEKSKALATSLYWAADVARLKLREYSSKEPYWSQNLAICRDTLCPAVLTENLFMDNQKDVEFMLSDEGKLAITNTHVQGIIDFIKNKRA